jgi:hypothetical protein
MNRPLRRCLALVPIVGAGALLAGCGTNPISRDAMIRYNLTPELDTLYQRPVDQANAYSLMNNENWRMFWEDMGRFWYVDRPSRLAPEPVPH